MTPVAGLIVRSGTQSKEGAMGNGHGGSRPGGGRPREGVQFSIRLPEEWVERLDRIAELEGFRRADAVRMVVSSGLKPVLRLSESLARARERSGLDEDKAMELAVEETRANRREKGRQKVTFDRITAGPDQMGGVPCIRGLRIPAVTVARMARRGMTCDEILHDYPDLEGEDVAQAVAFADAAEAAT